MDFCYAVWEQGEGRSLWGLWKGKEAAKREADRLNSAASEDPDNPYSYSVEKIEFQDEDE